MCCTKHVWMYAYSKLNIIRKFTEASQQLRWEWNQTNRRLCVHVCIWWMEETKPDNKSSEQLVVKPLHVVKAFYHGWNSSEQPVTWRNGRALCHNQCYHEWKLTVWHINIKKKLAYLQTQYGTVIYWGTEAYTSAVSAVILFHWFHSNCHFFILPIFIFIKALNFRYPNLAYFIIELIHLSCRLVMLSSETNDCEHIPEANFENNIRSLEVCIRLVLQNSRASDIMFYQAYILNSLS
jgi:hypothetical protein